MLHRLFYVLLLGAVACGLLAWTRIPTLPQWSWSLFDVTAPDNPRHPLNRNLVGHWQVLPQTNQAGSVWRSTAPMAAPWLGTLTSILPTSTASGWNATTRSGGFGEMRFDGTSDYIDLGINRVGVQLHGTAGSTIAAWVKQTGVGSGVNAYWAFFGPTNLTMLRMGLQAANPATVEIGGRAIWSDTFQSVTSTATIPLNTWTHIVGVVDYAAATMAIYLNGVLNISAGVTFTSATFVNDTTAPTVPDLIGATFLGTYEFVGAVDDIRLLTRALSAPEVAALYDATKTMHNPTLQWLPHLVAQPSGVLAFKPRRSGAY